MGSSPTYRTNLSEVFMRTFEEFKTEIKKATTKEELSEMSYQAFIQDTAPIDMRFLVRGCRPKTLSDKVNTLCTKRKAELGLL